LAVVACGLALGLPLSYEAARSFVHLLHEVRPLERLVGATVEFLVLLTTAVSTYLPARKAAHVDPVVALRSE
jgi:putative ABC transport system permease protein